MTGLVQAISWTGTEATMSMFVLSPQTAAPALDLSSSRWAPDRVRTYEMFADDAEVRPNHHVYEYDLTWSEVPDDLEEVVTTCLAMAEADGAPVAWFGFEGSFHFDYLFHPEIADQVYAVFEGGSVRLALDDEVRASPEWRELIGEVRNRVL